MGFGVQNAGPWWGSHRLNGNMHCLLATQMFFGVIRFSCGLRFERC